MSWPNVIFGLGLGVLVLLGLVVGTWMARPRGRNEKCPGCGQRSCDWRYGKPIQFAGCILPVILCKNADPDRVHFSVGQPLLASWDKP